MLTFVTYDISDNTSRNNLIKRLQHFGLYRVQKSIFAGHLDIDSRLNLAEDFELYISSDKDSILIVPVCENCLNSTLIEGNLVLPQEEQYKFL